MSVPARTPVLALAAALVLLSLSPALSQQFQRSQSGTQELFLLAPRPLQRLLTEGRTAIAEGRYTDGVEALGSILQDDSEGVPEDLRGQDFFIRPGNGELAQSVKSRVIAELKDLPEEGRRSLEIQFGVRARQLLEEAVAKRDFDMIASVARRYMHTEASYDAMLLLAQYRVISGFPLAAGEIYDLLLDYPVARARFGVGLVESAVTCWLQADREDRALKTLASGSVSFPSEGLMLAGQQIPLKDTQQIIQAIKSEIPARTIDRSTSDWLTTGGSASRNATSEVGMPLSNIQWSWPIHSSRPEGMALQEAEESERKNGRLLLPRIELRAMDRTIISRSNDSSIIGIDLDSGLFTWQRPTSVNVAPLKEHMWETGDNQLSKELKSRIWGSNAFGRITCDSQRCYHVVHRQSDTDEVRTLGMGYRHAATTRLEGISITGQGRILWSVGGADSDEPALTTAFFLGPPLPYAGSLYCIADMNGQTELLVLDPNSGKLQWRQQLSSSLMPVEFDQGRQAQGLMPSIADGVIVCPSGSGTVVAIDLLTRSFRWGINYGAPNSLRALQLGGGAFGGADWDPLDARWFDESLVIENGWVVLTPPESEWMFVLDLLTGEELMRRPRAGACFVAGIFGKQVVLVNNRSVQALQIEPTAATSEGRRRWQSRVSWEVAFPAGHALAGRGIWQTDKLMLPLTQGMIIQIDLKSGQMVDSTVVSQSLGNLFAHQDVLLSVGPTAITAFYTRKQLESAVQTRLAVNPKDTWALNHQAQLLLADQQTAAAFQMLLDSYSLEPNNSETRLFLVDAMLVGLQQDFSQFSKYTDQLDAIVIPETPERSKYLQLLAKGLMDQGDHFAAIQRLWEIMSERRSALIQGVQNRQAMIDIDSDYQVDLDAWFSVELGRLYEQCTAEQQAQVASWVANAFTNLSSTVVTVRRQMLRHMLQLPAAESTNLDLAESLLDLSGTDAMQQRGEQLGAEQVLTTLIHSPQVDTRERAQKLLSRIPLADKELPLPGTEQNEPWPSGALVRQADESDDAIYTIGRPVETISERFGRPPITIASADRLVFSDVNGKSIFHLGYRQATSDLIGSYMRAEFRGGLVLLETTSELLAIDFYKRRDQNQSILWRYSLDNAAPREQFQTPRMVDSTTGALGIPRWNRVKSDDRPYVEVGPILIGAKVLQNGGSVIGLDPYTGRKLWSRSGYGNDIEFAGSSQSNTLCIVSPEKGLTQLIDVRDGKLLGTNTYLVTEMSERWRDRRLNKWEKWFSYQNWIVDYVDVGDAQIRLRVWNPLEQQILLDTQLPNTARVAQSRQSQIVIAVPTGQLHLVDLETQQIHKYDVPVDQELDRISVLPFRDHLVVASNLQNSPNRPLLTQADNPASGLLYCINLHSKQLQWQHPGRLYNVAIPLIQPRNSPFMAALRFVPGSATISLLLIDLRTGKVAYSVEGPKLERNLNLSMEIRPENHELAVMLGERFYRFRATDQPVPPEPIIHIDTPMAEEFEIKRDPKGLFDQ